MSDSHAGPELVFFASLLLHQLDNHTHCHKKGERQSISLRKKKKIISVILHYLMKQDLLTVQVQHDWCCFVTPVQCLLWYLSLDASG